jgi:glycosyltransferase involved in cell wall biosynthesis
MNKLRKICFFVDMKDEQKTGLFNSTYQRISGLLKYIDSYEIYSYRNYDGKLYSLYKKFRKKEILIKGDNSFSYKNLLINYIYIKNTITNQLLKKMGFYCPIITALQSIKHSSKFEIICAHWGFPQGWIAYCLSKILNIPYTVTYHGSDVHDLPFIYKYYFKNLKKVFENANVNIFVSKYLMDFSKFHLGNQSKNNFVILNTVEWDNYIPLSKEAIEKLRKQKNIENKVVGYVGNLIEVKGADRLPELFKHVQEKFKDPIDFLIVGEGDYLDLIKRKSEDYGLNVKIIGKVEPEEIVNIMNIIDVLVLPSRKESFGLVILEANLCGTIAIATNNGGIPEAIGNSELVIKDGENLLNEMSEKVVSFLVEGYDRSELRQRVINNFNPAAVYEMEYRILNQAYLESKKKNGEYRN